MPLAKIHVLEGRYDHNRLAKISGAVQAARQFWRTVLAWDDAINISPIENIERRLSALNLNEATVPQLDGKKTFKTEKMKRL